MKTKILLKMLSTILLLVLATPLALFKFIPNAGAQAYRGLIIDQYRFDYEKLQPGDTVTGQFTATYDFQPDENGNTKSFTFDIYSQNFTQGTVAGTPIFLEKGIKPYESSLEEWISFDKIQITLSEAGQSETINFVINVPPTAESGGKYAAIFLQNSEGETIVGEPQNPLLVNGTGLNAAVGPLVFVTVDGDINSEISLADIYTTNIKGKETGFFFNPPVNVVIKFQNEGNTHVEPRGRVFIHKGDNFAKPIASFDLNSTNGVVLPETAREYILKWDDSFILTVSEETKDEKTGKTKYNYKTKYNFDKLTRLRFGKYRATVQFDYVDENGVTVGSVTGTTAFWVIPWQLIVLFLTLILIILSFGVYKLKVARK